MKPNDIKKLEEEFGLLLPPTYLQYLSAYPLGLVERYYDHQTWRCHICDEEFLRDYDRIADLNRSFREWCRPIYESVEVSPAKFWAIGSDVYGNFHLI